MKLPSAAEFCKKLSFRELLILVDRWNSEPAKAELERRGLILAVVKK